MVKCYAHASLLTFYVSQFPLIVILMDPFSLIIILSSLYRSPGSTKIGVSFSCEFVTTKFSQFKTYDAFISLVVVPDLPLALGAPMIWIIPPFYTTSSLLPFSSRSFNERELNSQKGSIMYSVLRICGEKTDDALNDGIAIHGDKIRTGANNVLACIKAEDRITRKAEIASCIRVAEVLYLKLFLFM